MLRLREPSALDLAVDDAVRSLKSHIVGSEEYVKTLELITRLHKIKEEEKPKSVSRETLAVIAANLLGIIMIINAEHLNVISRNAMQMLLKPRI
jgi:hypothetical protein